MVFWMWFRPVVVGIRAGGSWREESQARERAILGRRWSAGGGSGPYQWVFGPEVAGGRRVGRHFGGRVSSGVSLLAPLAAKKGLFVVRGAARDTPGDSWFGVRISCNARFSFSPVHAPDRFLCMPFRPSSACSVCQAPVSSVMRGPGVVRGVIVSTPSSKKGLIRR